MGFPCVSTHCWPQRVSDVRKLITCKMIHVICGKWYFRINFSMHSARQSLLMRKSIYNWPTWTLMLFLSLSLSLLICCSFEFRPINWLLFVLNLVAKSHFSGISQCLCQTICEQLNENNRCVVRRETPWTQRRYLNYRFMSRVNIFSTIWIIRCSNRMQKLTY